MPVWSAAWDPCVLRARVLPGAMHGRQRFDVAATHARRLAGPLAEHLAFDCRGEIARIDLVEGSAVAGAASLRFEIDADDRLDWQLRALRHIHAGTVGVRVPNRLKRQHLALIALDARSDGASWREIADVLLGKGDWPGEGEHRKSFVRRLVEAGAALCRSGPQAILRPG